MDNIILKNYTLLSKSEHESLLKIRNHEKIRKYSLSKNIIELHEHISWVDSLAKDTTKSYFAVFNETTLIGGINIFNKNENLKWGIFFSEETNLLIKSIVPIFFLQHIFTHRTDQIIYSEVFKNNYNALSFNKSLGFKEIEINDDIILLSLDFDTFIKKKKGILLKGIVKKMHSFNFEIKGLL
ncbi:hypothetical protein OAR97_06115 [Arcobacteraceae bacterium]|nr:hypothetical protein [Arcobacteraceae bacterium]